ncbi:hypothetical protein PAXINDRAFT_93883, partial [Paxillus involutus ATCC 200175]
MSVKPRPYIKKCTLTLCWTITLRNLPISAGFPPFFSDFDQLPDVPLPCKGVPLDWPVGTIFETYPWTQHEYGAKSLGYHFCAVEMDGRTFQIRSNSCTQNAGRGMEACLECLSTQTTKARLQIEERARAASPHTPYQFLTHQQLRELLRSTTKDLNEYKLKVLGLSRKLSTMIRRLTDSKRLIMAIASCEYPRVSQLIGVALRQGASWRAIIMMIQGAVEKLSHSRGYTTKDFELARLV